ncbi:zinc finger protein ZAT11-like [Mercurialis annua]|uniref:zinc finger protein ZAT11-like n=1 Tax=Mercurialis annua TaxID=3986 RepID=UPI00215EA2BE|nr:zinc finger protein ZAT11-like [Mercurialis annua]
MAMKRTRDNSEIENIDMAKCLMLLSYSLGHNKLPTKQPTSMVNDHVFECKTCNKKFSSFQALGGHRASHKRSRLFVDGATASSDIDLAVVATVKKPKMHECSICGVEFALGQALGGHMRRHRAAAMAKNDHHIASKLPVLRRSNSSKRVYGLDLNLTPLENDLEYLFGKMAPKVDLFI